MRKRRWPARDEVHLYWLRLDGRASAGALGRLSDAERRRAEAVPSAVRRARFVEARAGLRAVLARYLGCAAADVALAESPHGKPYLPRARALRFNLAHSRDRAVVAVSGNRAVGVDLERVRADVGCGALVDAFFAPAEAAAWRALPQRLRRRAFFAGWTRKEAVIKALGARAAPALHAFEVELDPRRAPAVLRADGPARGARALRLMALTAPMRYAAVLATAGTARVRVVRAP
ncbi:MAG: 4'-phosphopantetheinyl transferase superfamily protein [Vicinamibacteria bacterium]